MFVVLLSELKLNNYNLFNENLMYDTFSYFNSTFPVGSVLKIFEHF